MKRFDLLSRNISLGFQGSSTHSTRCGGFITLVMLTAVVIRLIYIYEDIYYRKDPTILFQEMIAEKSQQFEIGPNNYQLAIGITSNSQEYIINSRIYTIESNLIIKKIIYNEQNNKNETTWQTQSFKLEQCTKDHFKIQEPKDILNNEKYASQYCLPINSTFAISSNPESDTYSYLSFQIKRCAGVNCEESTSIDNFMKKNYVEVFFSDVYFTPEKKKFPFKYYDKTLILYNNANLSKQMNIYLRNNYVESDFGILYPDTSTEVLPFYSYLQEHIEDKRDDYVSNIIIRFESNKINYFKRTYITLIQIIQQLGGLIFVLYMIAQPICSIFSKIDLNLRLIQSAFTFNEIKYQIKKSQDLKAKEKIERSITSAQNALGQNDFASEEKDLSRTQGNSQIYQNNRDHVFQLSSDRKEIKSILKQKDSSPKENGTQEIINPAEKSHRLKKLLDEMKELVHNQEQIEQRQQEKERSMKEKIIDNIKYRQVKDRIKQAQKQISQVFNEQNNNMSFSLIEYLLSFFCRFNKLNTKRKVMNESVQQLNQQLDIQYLINKFTEIDCLKKVLLNDDQQILFQFLTKPCVNYSIIDKEVIFHDKQNEKQLENKYQEDCEKLVKGISSYRNILGQDTLEVVDNNLLKYLDQSYLTIFKQYVYRKRSKFGTNFTLQHPSIIINNKSPKFSPRKKSNQKKQKHSPNISPKDSPHHLSANQIYIADQILKKQSSNSSQKNSIQTPLHNSQVMINFQDQELSSDMYVNFDQDQDGNNVEENIKHHSSIGYLQRPNDSLSFQEIENIFLKKN